MMRRRLRVLTGILTICCGWAQAQAWHAVQAAAGASAEGQPAFTQEELDQMLAPIALYPDSLLSQILMASTYPLEIVQADRWVKANGKLASDNAAKALEAQPWDASVKSLVNFPDVLSMMSDQLDWTQRIGDAFLSQQSEVMTTIQTLRGKANDQGTLESNDQQTVEVTQEGSTQTIVIESADPDVIYVPMYDPTVVYGSWWYPAYPPPPYYPPGYVGGGLITFGLGVACGIAWGYAWGDCDWGHNDIDIDIDRNTNINNKFIDRDKYGQGDRAGDGSWRHNPEHRRGVGYRDTASAQRFGGQTAARDLQAREAYRGRADQARADLSRGGANQFQHAGGLDRGASGGLSDIERGGAATRQQSDRGWSSQGGGSRSGGVSRGGGGGRGGRGGGRRG